MSFKIDGLDNLKNQFKQMEKDAKDLQEKKSVSFDDLFSNSFMKKYTDFSSFNELLKAGKFSVKCQEDFKLIDEDEIDSHINSSTEFSTWQSMLDKATDIYLASKLGFK